jgi:TetR/AcrR family transcriptional regulator, transcriptional repressor for nem operon
MVKRAAKGSRDRNPEWTRGRLLQAAFKEIYRSGFQGTDLDTILSGAGVTKGALYHHFGSKEALGHAVVEEVIAGITREKWLIPLSNGENPIDTLIGIVQGTSLLPEHVICGCPLNNLSQEMSPLEPGFRQRVATVFRAWQNAIASSLEEGQKRELVRRDLDVRETATFLVALYEGYLSLAKNAQDETVLESGIVKMVSWLETLR